MERSLEISAPLGEKIREDSLSLIAAGASEGLRSALFLGDAAQREGWSSKLGPKSRTQL